MPFRFLPDYQIIIWHSTGAVTLSEISIDFNQIIELEKNNLINNYFANIADCELTHIKFEEVRQLYLQRKKMLKDEPIKTVLFVKTTLQFGVARIYQTLMTDTNNKVEVFKTQSECADFLNTPEELLFPKNKKTLES